LTRAELEVILGSEALEPSIISVKRLFALQAFVTMLSCFAWGWSVKGKPFGLDSSAISAMLGGLIAIIPAGLFAIRARLLTKKVIESGVARLAVAGLVTGEIIKIIATIAMFFLVIVFYPDLDWLPLLLTYVLALKCYWLAWILRK
jgi:ATP synthase protein I